MEGRYIVYKTNKVVRRVSFDEILYVESEGRQIRLETECGTLLYYEKISAIAPSFDDSFCRAMSYCYINLSKVRLISGGIVNFGCGKALVLCRDSFLRAKREYYNYLRRSIQS